MKRMFSKNYKTRLLSLILSMPCLFTTAQTLEEAVAATLRTNPKLSQGIQRIHTRTHEEGIAKASFYPSINLNGASGYEWTSSPTTRSGGPNTNDRLHRYESSITFRQEIYTGYSTRHDTKRAKATTLSEQYRYMTTASEIALSVARVYLGVLQFERALTLAQENLKLHRDISNNIFKRSKSGIQSTADLALISGRLANAEANVIASQNNLTEARLHFKYLTGVEAENLKKPTVKAGLIPQTVDDTIRLSVSQYPLLKSALEDNSAAMHEYTAYKGRYQPDVYFEAARSWNYNLNGIKGRDDDYTLMFHVRFNLFNGGGDHARVHASLSRFNESKDVYQQTLLQVREEASLAWEAQMQLKHQLPKLEKYVKYSVDTVKAYREQFSLGERSLLDVLNAEYERVQAALALNRAQTDRLEADYRLLHISGELLNALQQKLPETIDRKNASSNNTKTKRPSSKKTKSEKTHT